MVMIDGVWVRLCYVEEPAAAEARARRQMLDKRNRANERLLDREARCARVISLHRGLRRLSTAAGGYADP